MPVDEFGREIPPAGGGGSDHSRSYYAPSSSSYHEGDRRPYEDSSYYGRSRSDTTNDHSYYGRAPPPRSSGRPDPPRSYPPAHGGYSGGGSRHQGYPSQGGRRPSYTSGGGGRSGSIHHPQPQHPSLRYAEKPMLCQVLWKEKRDKEQAQQDAAEKGTSGDNDDKPKDSEPEEAVETEKAADDEAGETMDDAEAEAKKEEQAKRDNEAYQEYVREYCLRYVRQFFNKSLDDSWFRSRYSPLLKSQLQQVEQSRAAQEAMSIQQQVSGVKDPVSFLQQASLSSSGASSSLPSLHLLSWTQSPAPPAESSTPATLLLLVTDIPPHVTNEHLLLALKEYFYTSDSKEDAHLLEDSIDIYHSNVQTEQPVTTRGRGGRNRYAGGKSFLQRRAIIVARPQQADSSGSSDKGILDQLWSRCSSSAQQVHPGQEHRSTPASNVPRKEDANAADSKPVVLTLDVECTDPYGRLEYDANGKGGAPADGLAIAHRKSTVHLRKIVAPSAGTTTHPCANTMTLSAALSSSKRISRDKDAAVLLARAFDYAKSIPSECRLDALLEQLSLLLPQQEDATEDTALTDQDTLDVAIAYLRRVHLFSFYHGCKFADDVTSMSVLDTTDERSGAVPVTAGTIYLRRQDADSTTENKPTGETTTDEAASAEGTDKGDGGDEPKDLLVQRLDDSIAKALEVYVHRTGDATALTRPGDVLMRSFFEQDDESKKAVEAIQKAEADTKDQWLRDHSILDDDGRARCSFHFCHKLFKDGSFLQKHLLKKHREYMVAEQAKCHDEYMMKAWDLETDRPVPDILVDCGAKLGAVPSPVFGGQVPTANDPEPELWRKYEEEQEQRREAKRKADEMRQRDFQENGPRGGGGAPRPRTSSGGGGGFVDVDDMKEEKIEVSFDAVEVPVPAVPTKKKKKKRKLL